MSALKPRHPELCPERLLFDVRNGTWLVETIRASGHVRRANRPNTRLLLTKRPAQNRTCKKGAIHTGRSELLRVQRCKCRNRSYAPHQIFCGAADFLKVRSLSHAEISGMQTDLSLRSVPTIGTRDKAAGRWAGPVVCFIRTDVSVA